MSTPATLQAPAADAADRSAGQAAQDDDALWRWDDEGGAGSEGGAEVAAASPESGARRMPPSKDGDTARLHARVIALEHLVIALLAQASGDQRGQVRDMASYIAPRAGATPHPLTIEASARMLHLVERGDHFSSAANAAPPPDRA